MENRSLEDLISVSRANTELLTIETTVASGLEKIAEEECYEVFGTGTLLALERGRIFFNIPRDLIHKVFLMRSIDNVYIIVYTKKCTFVSDKNEDLLILKNFYPEIDWSKPISVWKEVYQYSGTLYPTKEEYEASQRIYYAVNGSNPKKCKVERKRHAVSCDVSDINEGDTEKKTNVDDKIDGNEKTTEYLRNSVNTIGGLQNDVINERIKMHTNDLQECLKASLTVPKFRVSAKRVGSHSFTSEDVAKVFGAVFQEDFLWIVDLTDFNMEIMTNVTDLDFIISISLTKSSLHRRNLTAFGLTSLRATICYSLIKLALPKVGDVVIDPLAGSGSIPIEGAFAFPKSYFLAGDSQSIACGLSKKNLDNCNNTKQLPVNLLQWDALKLPIRNSSVDVIVTDMPFGKRSGSKKSNKVLYPGVLKEFGRVLRKGSGRAVLLTADRRSLEMAHNLTKYLWNSVDRRHVNVGGIKAIVFLLRRTLLD